MVKEVQIKEEKINVKEKFEKGWLDVIAIIEIAGKPASHIKEVLEKLLEDFAKGKGIKLIYKKVHDVKEREEAKEVFSTFAELEFLAENLSKVLEFVVDYTPSSIEIVAPKDLALNINDANNVLNDIAEKIHRYESYVKGLAAQNMMLKEVFNRMAKEREEAEKHEKGEESEAEPKKEEKSGGEKKETEEKKKRKKKQNIKSTAD
jgi:hypothetical protein